MTNSKYETSERTDIRLDPKCALTLNLLAPTTVGARNNP